MIRHRNLLCQATCPAGCARSPDAQAIGDLVTLFDLRAQQDDLGLDGRGFQDRTGGGMKQDRCTPVGVEDLQPLRSSLTKRDLQSLQPFLVMPVTLDSDF